MDRKQVRDLLYWPTITTVQSGAHQRADLQQLEADSAAGRFGELGLLQGQAGARP
jgi:hypothetical protein